MSDLSEYNELGNALRKSGASKADVDKVLEELVEVSSNDVSNILDPNLESDYYLRNIGINGNLKRLINKSNEGLEVINGQLLIKSLQSFIDNNFPTLKLSAHTTMLAEGTLRKTISLDSYSYKNYLSGDRKNVVLNYKMNGKIFSENNLKFQLINKSDTVAGIVATVVIEIPGSGEIIRLGFEVKDKENFQYMKINSDLIKLRNLWDEGGLNDYIVDNLESLDGRYKDEMTGLYNKKYLRKINEISDSRYSFFFIDISLFKKINDMYGQFTGDEVIKYIGDIIGSIFRGCDIVCRLGGDEYGVLVKNDLPEEEQKRMLHDKYDELCKKICEYLPSDEIIKTIIKFMDGKGYDDEIDRLKNDKKIQVGLNVGYGYNDGSKTISILQNEANKLMASNKDKLSIVYRMFSTLITEFDDEMRETFFEMCGKRPDIVSVVAGNQLGESITQFKRSHLSAININ